MKKMYDFRGKRLCNKSTITETVDSLLCKGNTSNDRKWQNVKH